jgi:hypothetical protein
MASRSLSARCHRQGLGAIYGDRSSAEEAREVAQGAGQAVEQIASTMLRWRISLSPTTPVILHYCSARSPL